MVYFLPAFITHIFIKGGLHRRLPIDQSTFRHQKTSPGNLESPIPPIARREHLYEICLSHERANKTIRDPPRRRDDETSKAKAASAPKGFKKWQLFASWAETLALNL